MRTWTTRLVLAVLSVSVLNGAVAGVARAADGEPAVQAGVSRPVPAGAVQPGRRPDPRSVTCWPGGGPKHE